MLSPSHVDQLVVRIKRAEQLALFIDYDGTLVPIADSPELARPDSELLDLLRDLAARPNTEIHLVSGRTKGSIDEWFGKLPISLHAEHGVWSRPRGGGWTLAANTSADWKIVVRPILDRVAAETPGTFVEEKTAGLAWHYRNAAQPLADDAAHIDGQAQELTTILNRLLVNAPAEVTPGKKVIEVRPLAVDKGTVVPDALRSTGKHLIVAIGDDRADEDLFAVLPADSITVRVGNGGTQAQYRVADYTDVRKILASLRD